MEPVTSHSEREWILIGMAERCAAQGFAATGVDDVCAAAGVSRESFEDLFVDEADCLAATVEAATAQARQALDEAISPRQSWAANLRDGAAALLGFLAARPALAHVLLIEAPPAGGRAAAVAESARGELLALLERGREHATEEIPASAGRGALAGAEALIARQVAAGGAADLPAVAPDVVYMLAVPFLGLGEAQRLAAGANRRRHLRAVA
ncbi:MAG TPA: hypothetical protein VFG58_06090 [Solirubrobacterales bacterium]|nr:hypothetical protein [Solirubrobacterales bacterium]